MATESTLKRILREVSFPKDAQGHLRVIVDNQQAVTAYVGNSSTRAALRAVMLMLLRAERSGL